MSINSLKLPLGRRAALAAALCLMFGAQGPVAAQDTAQSAAKAAAPKPAAPASAKAHSKKAAPAKLELEPKALEILRAAGARLAAAHTLKFTALETFESLSRQGAPLAYGNKFDVVLQRPNKLRVILEGDGPASEFYYDGKAMAAYAPAENLLAVADAPATIDATLKAAFESAGIYFPFTDFIVADPYGDMSPGLKHAYYIGQSKVVGGVTTDIVAFLSEGVFAQVWIGADDKLPRLVHAIYLDDPYQLRHNLFLSDWKLDEPVADDVFGTSRGKGAKPIPFAHPGRLAGASQAPPKPAPATKTAPATSSPAPSAPSKTAPPQP